MFWIYRLCLCYTYVDFLCFRLCYIPCQAYLPMLCMSSLFYLSFNLLLLCLLYFVLLSLISFTHSPDSPVLVFFYVVALVGFASFFEKPTTKRFLFFFSFLSLSVSPAGISYILKILRQKMKVGQS